MRACGVGSCLECEKLVLDKQHRLLSFCQYRDDSLFRIAVLPTTACMREPLIYLTMRALNF